VQIFLTHHDQSVVKWFLENETASNIHLARDNDIVELASYRTEKVESVTEDPIYQKVTTSSSFDAILEN